VGILVEYDNITLKPQIVRDDVVDRDPLQSELSSRLNVNKNIYVAVLLVVASRSGAEQGQMRDTLALKLRFERAEFG
jgi:hypothetical protein